LSELTSNLYQFSVSDPDSTWLESKQNLCKRLRNIAYLLYFAILSYMFSGGTDLKPLNFKNAELGLKHHRVISWYLLPGGPVLHFLMRCDANFDLPQKKTRIRLKNRPLYLNRQCTQKCVEPVTASIIRDGTKHL
jgi:hypothetical protein